MTSRKHKRPSQPLDGRGGRMRPLLAHAQGRHVLADTTNGQIAKKGFSMRDEARNTASHDTEWGRDARLRLQPVAFVSAGFIKPLDDLDDKGTPDEAGNRTQAMATLDEDRAASQARQETNSEIETEYPTGPEMVGVADNVGQSTPSTSQGHEALKGREITTLSTAQINQLEATVDETKEEQNASGEDDFVQQTKARTTLEGVIAVRHDNGNDSSGNETRTSPKDGPPSFFFDLVGDKTLKDNRAPKIGVPETHHAADGDESGEDVVLFKGRKSLASQKTEPNKTRPVVRKQPSVNEAISLVEMRYEIGVVEASLSKPPDPKSPATAQKASRSAKRFRRRRAMQEEDDEMNEIINDYIANMASDLEDEAGSPFNAQRDIGGDHDALVTKPRDSEDSIVYQRGQQDLGFSTNTSDGNGEEDGLDDGEDGVVNVDDDDDDAIEADMDDETLARLYAKQEELGIGGDELVLSTDVHAKVKKRKPSTPAGPALSKITNKGTSQASSVPMLADPFDNLDLMNNALHGMSAPRKGRRSKQPPSFNVSDSELENTLRTSWQNDRERKKNRKLAREKMREAGLLGKDVNPGDLQLKYLEGISLENIKMELRDFILGSEENLPFPPMDKQARMELHKLATKFKIKTQSTGNGDQRRPVLYRTEATRRYIVSRGEDPASDIDRASSRIRRRFFFRPDKKGAQSPRRGGGRGGGGPSIHAAVTLRDGEVAGASVPKIGEGNRGRTMLEKMGWSLGMALGSADNQGILEPVKQVVKRSKAGLGQGGRAEGGTTESDG